MMLPVCFEAVLSVYAPAEASTRCLGFQAMESTNGCCPLTGTVQGFLPTWTTLFTTQSLAHLGFMPLRLLNLMWQHDTRALAHSSKSVWTHAVILALRARHRISPGCLEIL